VGSQDDVAKAAGDSAAAFASSVVLSAKELVKWVEALVIYLFMASQVDRRWGKWIVLSLVAAGSIEALFGVYQFFRRVGPEGFVLFGQFMRAYGHFAQPNPFAGYLGLVAPLAYALGLQTLDLWSGKATCARTKMRDVLSGVAGISVSWGSVVVILVAIMMSWSRGAWLGVIAALTVVTAVRSRRTRVALLGATVLAAYVLGAGGAQFLPSSLVERFSGLLPYVSGVDVTRVDINDANWAVIERTAHWLAAIGMFADHPWIGVGIGNYSVAYAEYALGRWQDPLGHAHNYYLNVAAEAGLVGLLAYLTLFVAAILQAWHGAGRPVEAEPEGNVSAYWRVVTLGVLGVLVHLSMHSLFDNLYVHSMNVQLGMVLGLLAVAQKGMQSDAHRV
jgi:putative inorganic carbon (HCO3(-)) transporter